MTEHENSKVMKIIVAGEEIQDINPAEIEQLLKNLENFFHHMGHTGLSSSVYFVQSHGETVKAPEFIKPEGCIGLDDVKRLAADPMVDVGAVSIGWTRLMQRATHNYYPVYSKEGVKESVEQAAKDGVEIYTANLGHRDSYQYHLSYLDPNGKYVQLFKRAENTPSASIYDLNGAVFFLIKDAYVQAVSEGWLDEVPKTPVVYSGGFGVKYLTLFNELSERVRLGKL
jgi:hypothetical protein